MITASFGTTQRVNLKSGSISVKLLYRLHQGRCEVKFAYITKAYPMMQSLDRHTSRPVGQVGYNCASKDQQLYIIGQLDDISYSAMIRSPGADICPPIEFATVGFVASLLNALQETLVPSKPTTRWELESQLGPVFISLSHNIPLGMLTGTQLVTVNPPSRQFSKAPGSPDTSQFFLTIQPSLSLLRHQCSTEKDDAIQMDKLLTNDGARIE